MMGKKPEGAIQEIDNFGVLTFRQAFTATPSKGNVGNLAQSAATAKRLKAD